MINTKIPPSSRPLQAYYVELTEEKGMYRRITTEDDPMVKKLRKIEKLKHDLRSANFVEFDGSAANKGANGHAGGGPGGKGGGESGADGATSTGVGVASGSKPDGRSSPEEAQILGVVLRWDETRGFG